MTIPFQSMTQKQRNEYLLEGITPIPEDSPGKFAVGDSVVVNSSLRTAWKQATVLDIPMEGWRVLSTVDDMWLVRKVTDLADPAETPTGYCLLWLLFSPSHKK